MVGTDNRHTLHRFKHWQLLSKSPNLCPPHPPSHNSTTTPDHLPFPLNPPSHHLPYPAPLSLGDRLCSRPVGVESPICGLILLRRRAVNTHFCGCQFGEGRQWCGTQHKEPVALPAVWEMLVDSSSAAGAGLSHFSLALPTSDSFIVPHPMY